MQEWLRAQIEGDPPPRRVKKEPDYKFPKLLEELENGKPGSKRFWELFPKNHDLNGPGPYTLNDSLLMDKALALDYPHLRKVEDVCHELANGVDQGKAQAQQGQNAIGFSETPGRNHRVAETQGMNRMCCRTRLGHVQTHSVHQSCFSGLIRMGALHHRCRGRLGG